MYEEISLKQCIQEIMCVPMCLPNTYFKMIRQKWYNFRAKMGPVLRKFKMETQDDQDFVLEFVSEYLAQTVLMTLLSIVIYSICYMTLEFKTVRL